MIGNASKVLYPNTLHYYSGGILLANLKRKTVGFSIRIDEEWLEVLRKEAERQTLSVNALMNKVFHDYCVHWRWAETFGAVLLTRQTLGGIVACCPEDSLAELGKASGSTGAKDLLRTIGVVPTYNTLLQFIQNMAKFGNWFDYSKHTNGRKELIHLRHELGRKWSIFIANQVATMFKSTLGITTKMEINDNYATLELPL